MVPEEMDINVQVHRTFASFSCPRSATLQQVWAWGKRSPMPKLYGMHKKVKARNLCVSQLFRNYGKENLATPGLAQV